MVVAGIAEARQERNPSKKMTKRNQSAIRSVMRKFTEHAMLYQHTTEKLAEYRSINFTWKQTKKYHCFVPPSLIG